MRCIPIDTKVCATMLALWAGFNYVLADTVGTVHLAVADGRPARDLTLVAERRT